MSNAGTGYARALIAADKAASGTVRELVYQIPLADLADTIVALTGYASAAGRLANTVALAPATFDPKTLPDGWTYEDAKRAHAAWNRGEADPFAFYGERIYQRMRKQAQRERAA